MEWKYLQIEQCSGFGQNTDSFELWQPQKHLKEINILNNYVGLLNKQLSQQKDQWAI